MAYSLTLGNTSHNPGGRLLSLLEQDCQFAYNRDPRFASNRDPSGTTSFVGVTDRRACPGSPQEGPARRGVTARV